MHNSMCYIICITYIYAYSYIYIINTYIHLLHIYTVCRVRFNGDSNPCQLLYIPRYVYPLTIIIIIMIVVIIILLLLYMIVIVYSLYDYLINNNIYILYYIYILYTYIKYINMYVYIS